MLGAPLVVTAKLAAVLNQLRNSYAVGGIRFASPEDTLLYKLVSYRLGSEQSERQWNDVLGVIRIQAERLDRAYVRLWAKQLGVTDLVARALDT